MELAPCPALKPAWSRGKQRRLAKRHMARMHIWRGDWTCIFRVYPKMQQHNPHMIGSDYVFDNFKSPIMPAKSWLLNS